MNRITIAFIIALTTAAVHAQSLNQNGRTTHVGRCYDADVVRVYDADTIWANLYLGFDVALAGQSVRILGIDAPEVRGPEQERGIIARDALRARLPQGTQIDICTDGRERDNFGRILAHIFLDGEDLGQWLLEQGLVAPYKAR